MKRSRFSSAQGTYALPQAEVGISVVDMRRRRLPVSGGKNDSI